MTKRDNAYYRDRLQREHPGTFADVQSGKVSLKDALLASGLKKQRTRIHELKNAWNKASSAERSEFVRFMKPAPKAAAPVLPISIDRRLQGWAMKRIERICLARSMSNSDVMDELGIGRSDTSLWMAIRRNTRLAPSMIAAIEKWLDTNKSV